MIYVKTSSVIIEERIKLNKIKLIGSSVMEKTATVALETREPMNNKERKKSDST